MEYEPFVAGLFALALTLLLSPAALMLLRRFEVLDYPSERTLHDVATPRGGGIPLAVAALTALVILPGNLDRPQWGLLIAGGGLALVGLAEDLWGIRKHFRFAWQVLIALVATQLLMQGGRGPYTIILVAAASLWIVSYVNAFNFMDGINGSAVVQAVATGLFWYFIGKEQQLPFFAATGLIVAAATLGFAPFNFPGAMVFLGDTGSYFLGAWLGASAVLGVAAGLTPEAVIGPLAIGLADTGTTLIKRARMGKNWSAPHKEHTYQRLVSLGWSHARVAWSMGAFILACGTLGASTLDRPLFARALADAAVCLLLLGYLALPTIVARKLALK